MGRNNRPKSEESVPVGFRIPKSLQDRLIEAGNNLGLDVSNLLRMMIIKHLPAYEDEGKKLQPKQGRPSLEKS